LAAAVSTKSEAREDALDLLPGNLLAENARHFCPGQRDWWIADRARDHIHLWPGKFSAGRFQNKLRDQIGRKRARRPICAALKRCEASV